MRDVDGHPECDDCDVILQCLLIEVRVYEHPGHLAPDSGEGVPSVVVGHEDVHPGVEAALHPRQAVGGRHQVPVSHKTGPAENVAS